MAKIELKGTITGVGAIEKVGKNEMLKQLVIFKVPAYRDDFGETRGTDEDWLLEVIGNNVNELKLSNVDEGKKAKITVFVESRLVTLQTDPKIAPKMFYQISAKLWKVEFKA
jgi:hypothetical protein